MGSPLIREKVLLPPPGWRKAITASATRLAKMRQGWKCAETGAPLEKGNYERHHDPPLHLREYDPWRDDTIPPANDYHYIRCVLTEEHRRKLTPANRKEMEKTDRCRAMQESIDAALTKPCGQKYRKRGKIPSRPFRRAERMR